MKVGFQMPNEICLQTLFQAGCPWFTLPACNINSYVGKWTQLSEICAQFVHRSAVLNNERLVETITRPSAAAALSILIMFNILNTCTKSTNMGRGGGFGVCSSENLFQAILLN